MLAEPVRQPDGAADVLGVLVADHGGRVQRVAVAVQAGDRHAGALEDPEVVVPGGVAGQDVVEGGDVHRRQEAAGVDLDAGEAEIGDDLQRFGQRPVVQDRVVDAESHADTFVFGGCHWHIGSSWSVPVLPVTSGGNGDATATNAGRLGDRGEQLHVVHAFVEGGAAGQRGCFVDAGDLFQEGPRLVGEGVVLAEADTEASMPSRRTGTGVPGRG